MTTNEIRITLKDNRILTLSAGLPLETLRLKSKLVSATSRGLSIFIGPADEMQMITPEQVAAIEYLYY